MPSIFIRVGSRYRKSWSSRSVYARIGLAGSKKPDAVHSR